MPVRSPRWIWAGRAVFLIVLIGLAAYLISVGLDQADKLASSIGLLVALTALGAPYLLPHPPGAPSGPDSASAGAGGPGAVAIGGNNRAAVTTDVSGVHAAPPPSSAGDNGVRASGPGSVAIGGDNTGTIGTRVTGPVSPPPNP